MRRARSPRTPDEQQQKPRFLTRPLAEALEGRRLLTLVGVGAPSAVFSYLSPEEDPEDETGERVEVRVLGNMQVDLIGYNGTTLGDMPGVYDIGQSINGGLTRPGTWELFHVRIVSADPDSALVIQRYALGEDGITYAPVDSAPPAFGVETLLINDPTPPFNVDAPGDTGEVWIGYRENLRGGGGPGGPAGGSSPRPVTQVQMTTAVSTVQPPPDETLEAGISSLAGANPERILIGGTVTGRVEMLGSVDLFYAGWLVTGDITGVNSESAFDANWRDNFYVAGDVGRLFVLGGIGTELNEDDLEDPITWSSGTEILVGGSIGGIFAGAAGALVSARANHSLTSSPMNVEIEEIENRTIVGDATAAFFVQGELADLLEIENDTAATPEMIGTFSGRDTIVINGSTDLVVDFVDYYALGLMAGQRITIQSDGVSVGLIDSDNRLVATNYSKVAGSPNTLPFAFQVDRPGMYRIAVGQFLPTYVDDNSTTSGVTSVMGSYQLTISDVGDLAIGGLRSSGIVFETTLSSDAGDVGVLYSDLQIWHYVAGARVNDAGANLRAIESVLIGRSVDSDDSGDFLRGVSITAGGSVGEVRSTAGDAEVYSAVIGGDFQSLIAVPGEDNNSAYINLSANGGMGMYRAGTIGSVWLAPVIRLNADESPNGDGILGLIDGALSIGTPETGGPQIYTGVRGNVKFMRAPSVYRDVFFGTRSGAEPGSDIALLAEFFFTARNEEYTFVDDGGANINLRPIARLVANPDYDPNNPFNNQPPTLGARLGLKTYGIRSGGAVLMDLRVGSDAFGAEVLLRAMEITTGGGVGSAEISNFTFATITGTSASPLTLSDQGIPIYAGGRGISPPWVRRRNAGGTSQLGSPAIRIDVTMSGGVPLDVMSMEMTTYNLTTLVNETGGSIIGMNVQDIGELRSRGDLGIMPVVNGVQLVPSVNITSPFATQYPFDQQRWGIVARNLGIVSAGGAVGNIIAAAIQSVTANAGGNDQPGKFEGIAGPIVTTGTGSYAAAPNTAGNIGVVQIGEGIASSGSGNTSRGGIYAARFIFEVTGGGEGNDIRGEVLAQLGIGRIALGGGSIINANIMNEAEFANAREYIGGFSTIQFGFDAVSLPNFEIGEISVGGNGGVIGSFISGRDIGPINISGFGFFTSVVVNANQAQFAGIRAAGYGIRNSSIAAGTNIGHLTATGDGSLVSARDFSRSVRPSEQFSFDPFSGVAISQYTDLHAALGTSAAAPLVPGVTDTGVIENTLAVTGQRIGSVSAWQIRQRGNLGQPAPGQLYEMQLNAGNSIGSISTTDIVDGLAVVSGRVSTFRPGSDVARLRLQVSGRVANVTINGSLLGDSLIQATGPAGTLGKVLIKGDLNGTIRASQLIQNATILGNVAGAIIVDGPAQGRPQIGTLSVANLFEGSTLQVTGSINKLIFREGGAPTSTGLTVNGNLNTLQVLAGTMDFDLTVNGTLGNLDIRGSLNSDVNVTNNLGRVRIKNSDPSATSLAGNITVNNAAGAIQVFGGNVTGSVTVGGSLDRFDLINGNVLAGASIRSLGGDLRQVNTTGSFAGDLAAAGRFGAVQIRGDLGNGTDVVTLSASSTGSFHVAGSILSGVIATLGGPVGELFVGGNVQSGATVAAGSYGRKTIVGSNNGAVTP